MEDPNLGSWAGKTRYFLGELKIGGMMKIIAILMLVVCSIANAEGFNYSKDVKLVGILADYFVVKHENKTYVVKKNQEIHHTKLRIVAIEQLSFAQKFVKLSDGSYLSRHVENISVSSQNSSSEEEIPLINPAYLDIWLYD